MADVKYVITADAKGAVGEIKKVEGAVQGMKTQAKQSVSPLKGMIGQIALGAGAALAAKAAIRGMVRFMGSAIEKAKAQEIVMAKLDAVLRSTGGAAGITKEEVVKLASGLQDVTTYGDETILSAQNLLLTFTKIGKDVFPDATEIVLDMSAALGQDLKSSAIQVGKALQDPILGATALRRVGVNLSQSQADLIKKMVEAGDVMGAQKLILTELKSEFGGTAREIRDTFQGSLDGLKNAFGDVQEQIGTLITENDTLNDALGITEGILKNLAILAPAFKEKLEALIDSSPILKGLMLSLVLINVELELQVAKMKATETQADALKWAFGKLNEGLELLGINLPFVSDGIKDTGDNAETAKTKIAKLPPIFKSVEEAVKELLEKADDLMEPEDVKAWVTEWESAESALKSVLENTGLQFGVFNDGVSDDTKETVEEINQYWDNLTTDLGNAYGTLFLELTNKNTTFEESFEIFGGRLVDSFRATIADMISDWVTGFIQELVSSAAGAGESIAGSIGGALGGSGVGDIAGGVQNVTSALGGLASPIGIVSQAVTAIASVAQLFKKSGPSSTDSWHFEHIWINAKEIRDYMYLVQRNWLTKEIPERISRGNAKLDDAKKILRDIRGNTADIVKGLGAIPGGQHGLDFQSGNQGGLVRYHPNERINIQPNFSASVNVSATPIYNTVNLRIADRHIMEVVKRNSVEWSTHHGLKFNRRGLVG